MYSPEALAELAQIRARVADNSVTLEELKRAIIILRGDRRSAAAASETSRRKAAKAAIPNADDLLNELGGI